MSYPAYFNMFIFLGHRGEHLTWSKGPYVNNTTPSFWVPFHFLGQGGESGSPMFETNNVDNFTIYGALSMFAHNHVRILPEVFYSFENVVNNNSPSSGSCLDLDGACPDVITLSQPETDLGDVHTKYQLIIDRPLNPAIGRDYKFVKPCLVYKVHPHLLTFFPKLQYLQKPIFLRILEWVQILP